MRKRMIVFATLLLALPCASALAQESGSDGWEYDLALYGVGAGLDGQVTIRGVEAAVDVGFSDIVENLEMGGLVAFRAKKDRWSVMVDSIFLGVGATTGVVDVDVDQLILEVDGAYRFTEIFDVFFGLRYVDIEGQLHFLGPLDFFVDGSQDWVDPVVGLRLEAPLSEKWTFYGRFDMGGFGVGSDFSYQVGLNLGYRATDALSIALGWRSLDFDYDDGEDAEHFVYDVLITGPQLAFIFHF